MLGVFGPYCKLRTEFFSIDLWPARFALGVRFENWTLCLAQSCFYLSFVGLWKNAANEKEARQDDRVQACLLSYLWKELLIFS